MCERCVEIDEAVARYRALAAKQTDQRFLDGIKQLIDQKLEEKAALHPEEKLGEAT